MQFEGVTLFFLLMLLSWTGVLVIGFCWLTNRHEPALKLWFYSLLFNALGAPAAVLRLFAPEWISVFLANFFYFSALICFIMGHTRYFSIDLPKHLISTASILYFAVICYFFFLNYDTYMRVVSYTLISSLVSVYVALIYIRAVWQDHRAAYQFAMLAFLLGSIATCINAYYQFSQPYDNVFDSYGQRPWLNLLLIWSQLMALFIYYILINARHIDQLNQLANYDALTATYCRRYFMDEKSQDNSSTE